MYDSETLVTAEVIDNIKLDFVELFYKIGPAAWTSKFMTNVLIDYSGLIPQADYGTEILYYFEAVDIHGILTSSGSSTSPYSFIVDDQIDPILDVEAPTDIELSGDGIMFNVTAEDPGAGIDYIRIIVDTTTVYTGNDLPYTFILNTTDYENGDLGLGFWAYDNAGNEESIGILISIYNAPEPTNVGAIFGGLVSFGLVTIASSTMIYFSERRKKYLKLR